MISFFKKIGIKGIIGIILVSINIFIAIFAPVIAPHDPLEQNLILRLKPPGTVNSFGVRYVLGTDSVGRDVMSRLIYGARLSILIGVVAMIISGVIGTILGLIAGFFGNIVDTIIMRIVDMQLAIPMIIFAIMWVVFFGSGIISVTVVIGFWGWVQFARFTRGNVLTIKQKTYIEASKAIGASNISIIFKHITPNLIGSVIVLASLRVGQAVLLESTLSFIGVGIQPPTPTWGNMLAENRDYLDLAWWTAVFPGISITSFVLGVNLLGDILRDLLDPKLK